jgi:cytochrome P450
MTITERPPATTPPTAPGSPWLGSAPAIRRDLLGTCARAFADQGDVVRFRLGPPGLRRILYMVSHPDGVQRVLAGHSANYRKDSAFYNEIRLLLGDGILTSQDELWLRQKRFVQPLFTARRVAAYADDMVAEAEAMADGWRGRTGSGAGGAAVDLHDEMTRLTLRIVCRVLFGDDTGDAIPVVQRAFPEVSGAVRRRGTAPVRVPLGWPTPLNARARRFQRQLHGVCDDIIARRRRTGGGQSDLVGLLLAAQVDGAGLTDREIRDQVLIFLLAGHETTSTALTYALHLLGRHPDVQRRVRAEVAEVVGDRAPTAADQPGLAYTTMVLKETMRLYPSAPVTGRPSVAEDEICGFTIPAGSDVMVTPWNVHRHPSFWDDPERFDPLRFERTAEQARHRYAWMPFGGGPRACIGQHFSMLESVVVLAVLVRAFDFAAGPDEPPRTVDITLRPAAPVLSTISPVPGRAGPRS